jgi:hypothetical protein
MTRSRPHMHHGPSGTALPAQRQLHEPRMSTNEVRGHHHQHRAPAEHGRAPAEHGRASAEHGAPMSVYRPSPPQTDTRTPCILNQLSSETKNKLSSEETKVLLYSDIGSGSSARRHYGSIDFDSETSTASHQHNTSSHQHNTGSHQHSAVDPAVDPKSGIA